MSTNKETLKDLAIDLGNCRELQRLAVSNYIRAVGDYGPWSDEARKTHDDLMDAGSHVDGAIRRAREALFLWDQALRSNPDLSRLGPG